MSTFRAVSTDHNILIKVALSANELLDNSHIQQQLAKCGVNEPISFLEIRNPEPHIYAVLQHSECISNLIEAGEIPRDQYLSSEEYEDIITSDPDSVKSVEFVEDSPTKPECVIL